MLLLLLLCSLCLCHLDLCLCKGHLSSEGMSSRLILRRHLMIGT